MQRSGADALIVALEDFTPLTRRDQARRGLAALLQPCLVRRATTIVAEFDTARARGEDRALVDGLWVEVPTFRNARRVLERARRLNGTGDNDATAHDLRKSTTHPVAKKTVDEYIEACPSSSRASTSWLSI
jgi:citrate lyase beta subunit